MFFVEWKGNMAFEAHPPSGCAFTMDAHPDVGGESQGPTPVETLLGAIASCSAMDVISILRKKKQEVTAYRIEVEAVRSAPPNEWPRPITDFTIRHLVTGTNLDPAAVARAVELSDEKYCTVITTLRTMPKVTSEWRIEEPATTG